MASYKNFNIKDNKGFNHIKSDEMYNPTKFKQRINYPKWSEVLSYYRYYMDEFAEKCLGVSLFPFQRVLLRAMANHTESAIVTSRGLTKSFIGGLFAVEMGVLYPNIKIGIVSKQGNQSIRLIVEKIIGELRTNYPAIANEIQEFSMATNNVFVKFKNGSMIKPIILGLGQDGDGARGIRTQVVIVDEGAYVDEKVLSKVVIPMNQNYRFGLKEICDKFPDKEMYEKNKVLYLTSACLKTQSFYPKFLSYVRSMMEGSPLLFACALDYKVGVQNGVFSEESIEIQRLKPEMTEDVFLAEYCATFVGCSNESYFPYDKTNPTRTIRKAELEQPKNTKAIYVAMHDVATSSKEGSDNCATHIIKLQPKENGTYLKQLVYSKTQNGLSAEEQRDFLRELIHIKFPNVDKLVVDGANCGFGLLSLLAQSWEWEDKSGKVIEFPPLIEDDNTDKQIAMPSALPIIRSIKAYNEFNINAYTYTKACFENKTLQLTINSRELDENTEIDLNSEKSKLYYLEKSVHIEHDNLVSELSNIGKTFSNSGNIIFERIVQKKKRDRATSLIYGMYYIKEIEEIEIAKYNNRNRKHDDISAYLGFF